MGGRIRRTRLSGSARRPEMGGGSLRAFRRAKFPSADWCVVYLMGMYEFVDFVLYLCYMYNLLRYCAGDLAVLLFTDTDVPDGTDFGRHFNSLVCISIYWCL